MTQWKKDTRFDNQTPSNFTHLEKIILPLLISTLLIRCTLSSLETWLRLASLLSSKFVSLGMNSMEGVNASWRTSMNVPIMQRHKMIPNTTLCKNDCIKKKVNSSISLQVFLRLFYFCMQKVTEVIKCKKLQARNFLINFT